MNTMPALSIVIPAYNEASRLPRTLYAAAEYLEGRGTTYEILIVSDGSRDETRAVSEALAQTLNANARYGAVIATGYEQNQGKGYAVRFGMLRASGERLLCMDADLATPMEELPKLEAALDESTRTCVAIGSRPLRESELTVRQPLYRELAGRAFNKAVQLMATPGIHDTQCGFKLFTRSAARQIFERATLNGFSFDVEVLYLSRKLGFTIAEVPVRWAHQEGAAAFATRGAYLRHGIKMLRDLVRIRRVHRDVRPASQALGEAAPPL